MPLAFMKVNPCSDEVPDTVRLVIVEVVKVPWPMLSILTMLLSCRSPAAISKLPADIFTSPPGVKMMLFDPADVMVVVSP